MCASYFTCLHTFPFPSSCVFVSICFPLLPSLSPFTHNCPFFSSPSAKRKTLTLSERVGDESNKFLRSNIAHLLALVSDVLVSLNGGLKQLLAKAVNPKLSPRLKVVDLHREPTNSPNTCMYIATHCMCVWHTMNNHVHSAPQLERKKEKNREERKKNHTL